MLLQLSGHHVLSTLVHSKANQCRHLSTKPDIEIEIEACNSTSIAAPRLSTNTCSKKPVPLHVRWSDAQHVTSGSLVCSNHLGWAGQS